MNEGVKRITSEYTVFLDKPPCCLKFSPQYPEYFIVGTYNLVEKTVGAKTQVGNESAPTPGTQRNGSLVLFRLVQHNIIKISTTEVPYGVLDIQFQDRNLGVATSVGSFAIYDLSCPGTYSTPQLTLITTFQIGDPEVLVTSFAWDPTSCGRKICATLTSGDVGLVSIPLDRTPCTRAPLEAINVPLQILYTHSLEAWITAIAPSTWENNETQTIFSGGDDAVLSCLSSNTALHLPTATSLQPQSDTAADNKTKEDTTTSTAWTLNWTNKRIHDAGVTAILPLPLPLPQPSNPAHKALILLTGSYDDSLRVLLIPPGGPSKRPQVLHEVKLAGGVWRIGLLSLRTRSDADTDAAAAATLLVSCMYAGAYVIRLEFSVAREEGEERETREANTATKDEDTIRRLGCAHEIVGCFGEHESMCYACDALAVDAADSSEEGDGDKREAAARSVVSCSFYDRRVCLWRWQEDGRNMR